MLPIQDQVLSEHKKMQ